VIVMREEVAADASPDALDTVAQADAVRDSLILSGWRVSELLLGSDPTRLERELGAARPVAVFNLVESHLGLSSLACIGPAVCRKARTPFTGCDEAALALAGDKAATRRLLVAAGLPAPRGVSLDEVRQGLFPGVGTYIVKSRFEDASLGLGPDCVVNVTSSHDLLSRMSKLSGQLGGDCVAESFVSGREFNLALLAGLEGVMALPLAEMVFDPGYQGPAIVDYAAKWDEQSPAFASSWRSFEFAIDEATQAHMVAIGRRCWDLFGLAGYARIDFRVDESGRPYVIDVNPNPCIAGDAGFTAAAARAGLDHQTVVEMLVGDALRRAGQDRRRM